ncbi:ABC transporter ATP-binding protein [Desulfomonile tiedjei]|uniref:ABC-type multidrug transport system, ATPase and permease component n=1 Tax=Desulfomonile tiedjei (strain ATCC 49306 / DSM 6799 / DCB-1) TaxID=706587 RepID=I4C884_DESTA|nr:ABC transporter transmembrane domain-containing protein [Desulfomonile tiedjei]AFM25775.1 ABC-type multidrug transport system, ATPase and permease component [Desulfomonile tiedjei DSM 6799]
MHVYRRLLRYLSPYLLKLIVAGVCMIGVALATASLAYLVEPALDDIFLKKDLAMLIFIPLIVAVVYVVKGVCDFAQYYLMAYVGQSVIRDLREEMFTKLEQMSVGFFVRHSTGELLSRMNNDVSLVQGAMTSAITGIVRDAVTVIALICVVFYRDFTLALMAMVVFPLAVYPLLSFGKRLKRYSRRMLVSLEDITQRLNETITGIRIVKAFAMEDYERSRFREVNQTLFNAFMRRFKVRALSNPVMETLGGFGVCAIVFYGGYQVVNGISTQGTFFSFLAALFMLYEPIKRINEANSTIQEGISAGERIFALMDADPDVTDRSDAVELQTCTGEVVFDTVFFGYEDQMVLKGVSIRANPGEAIAIVGESGVGKSTLLDLIPRFYDVNSGAILVDGKDVRSLTQKSLREKIGVVTQQTILFDDTIRNNIAYGRPDLSLEKVVDAAKAAHAHDFIATLPNGYDTIIGENGIKLSGGERQRIAIARALLKNPPILILDEATSNLDSDSERAVQSALEELMRGRTTVVVAHRLSTIRNVDRIYVLMNGTVAEQGSHDELLSRDGEFARLYFLQFSLNENGEKNLEAAGLMPESKAGSK